MDTHSIAESKGWIVNEDFPEWGNNSLYLTTIQGGYLLENETPKEAYRRIAKAASKHYKGVKFPLLKKNIEESFFEILWNGWLIPSTPVMANLGTDIGLPISCFAGVIGDSMYDIGRKNLEMMMLSKNGGGTAYDWSGVRAAGSPIKDGRGGKSDGIIPFTKGFDSFILASKQGKTRRGAKAGYLNAYHGEYMDWLEIREPKGAIERQCHNIHQGGIFSDEFMEAVINKNGSEREIWKATLMKRVKTGEPYVFFIDNANKNLPQFWKKHKLKVKHSNLCTEIMLPTDEQHTLVCCLASLNLFKCDEWADTDTVFLSILLLDAVIEDFIIKGSKIPGIEDAVRFAIKSRALGLGALGWHSYLQSKMIPFIGMQANALTRIIFDKIKRQSEEATLFLGSEFGSPEWCEGTGRRNLTLLAIAPNRSSSKLGGGISESVQPFGANIYVDDDAKGLHIRRNIFLEKLLESKGMNKPEIWDQINENNGSVLSLDFLSDAEKEVFKTFKEINQLELVRQAAIRQQYIDQGQSINLSFFQDATAKWINKVHIEAWKLGLKALYYLRSESTLRADTKLQRDLYNECQMCEG